MKGQTITISFKIMVAETGNFEMIVHKNEQVQ